MSNDNFADATNELRLIRRLITAQLVQGMKQRDAIALLANAGLEPKQVADALGTTPGTVSVALVALRKEGKVRASGISVIRKSPSVP